jgi:hypothetical protein
MNLLGLKKEAVNKMLVVIVLCALVATASPTSFVAAETEIVDDTELIIDGQLGGSAGSDTGEVVELEFDIDDEESYQEEVKESVYTIDGYKYECTDVDDLGWDCSVPVAGWNVRAYHTNSESEEYVSAMTDAEGYYSLTVSAGEWLVVEEKKNYWYQVATIVNGESIEAEGCQFLFTDEPIQYKTAFVEDVLDTSNASCSFGNFHPTYKVSGVKWNDRNANGLQDEGESGIAGWKIYAQDENEDGELMETITNDDGYYEFNLELEGNWSVYEEDRSSWTQVAVTQNGELVKSESTIASCNFNFSEDISATRETSDELAVNNDDEEDVESLDCTFFNKEKSRHGGGGKSGIRAKNRAIPQPLVLGVATGTPACGMYLTDYMRMGDEASSSEVTKLQIFLNAVGITAPLTGIFDVGTDKAVRTFQAQHKATVLTPWYLAKLVPHENPTGWVYQLTRWKINNIVCPGSEAYPVLN